MVNPLPPYRAWLFFIPATMLIAICLAGCQRSVETPVSKVPAEIASAAPKRVIDPQAVEAITFADLDLPMEPDSTFQTWMLTQRVHDLTGRTVRIRGFMGNGLFQLRNIKEFVLLRDLDCCQFGPGGTADHLIQIKLQNNLSLSFTTEPITVEGRLTIEPFTGSDGKTWSVYRIDAQKVELGKDTTE